MKPSTTLALAATVLGSAALLTPAAQAESFSFHYSTGPSRHVAYHPAPVVVHRAPIVIQHAPVVYYSHPSHKPAWHPKYKHRAKHLAKHHGRGHGYHREVAYGYWR